ncbi:hypothetical protein [Micromonospora sp. DT62]|uniref:hypothetical protein n=1 Tax=Micromonospora sp. DT62 TaxID=3416521 RepID=UPI003CE85E66
MTAPLTWLKVTAEATLRRYTGRKTMSPDEIHRLVETLGNITTVLRNADPADKARVYRELGLTLTYRPTARTVSAQATPSGSCTKLCPRGDTYHCPTADDNRQNLEARASLVALVTSLGSLAFAAGAAVGVLGEMIGLGGAEFRLPLLIMLFGFAALQAVIVNKTLSLS